MKHFITFLAISGFCLAKRLDSDGDNPIVARLSFNPESLVPSAFKQLLVKTKAMIQVDIHANDFHIGTDSTTEPTIPPTTLPLTTPFPLAAVTGRATGRGTGSRRTTVTTPTTVTATKRTSTTATTVALNTAPNDTLPEPATAPEPVLQVEYQYACDEPSCSGQCVRDGVSACGNVCTCSDGRNLTASNACPYVSCSLIFNPPVQDIDVKKREEAELLTLLKKVLGKN